MDKVNISVIVDWDIYQEVTAIAAQVDSTRSAVGAALIAIGLSVYKKGGEKLALPEKGANKQGVRKPKVTAASQTQFDGLRRTAR